MKLIHAFLIALTILPRQILGHIFNTMQGHRVHMTLHDIFDQADGLGVLPVAWCFRVEPCDFIKVVSDTF